MSSETMTAGRVRLRPATLDDVPTLEAWDREPHVIACSSDRPDLEVAFDGIDWPDELAGSSEVSFYRIAEIEGRPIGVMQICDPHLEPTHYWGEIEPDLRAMDIWIGEPDALNRGYGTQMMTLAVDDAFADERVKAIVIDPLNSNTDAIRFYQRMGFEVVGRRMFDGDDCLVHRLSRERWEARRLVIPDAAKRRSGTEAMRNLAGPAAQPGQTHDAANVGRLSPGSPLSDRPRATDPESHRPGSSLRFGRDDKVVEKT